MTVTWLEEVERELTQSVLEAVRAIHRDVSNEVPLMMALANRATVGNVRDVVDRIWRNLPPEYKTDRKDAWTDLSLLSEEARVADAWAAQIAVDRTVYGAGHWFENFGCEEHLTSASECGCLELERQERCYTCGSRLANDGVNVFCILCESEALMEEFDSV